MSPRPALSRLWRPSINPRPALSRLRRPSINFLVVLSQPQRPLLNLCPVPNRPRRPSLKYHCSELAKVADFELSIRLVSSNVSGVELSVLPVSIKESKLELSVCLNAVVESEFESVGPDLSNMSNVEPCVCPISIYESVFCPTSPVTTPETLPELSPGSSSLVTAQGPAVELLTLFVMDSETINALSVCPVSTKEPDFENCLLVQVQPLKCLSVQFPSMSLLNDLFYQFLSMNCLLQSLSVPQILSYLSVLFQSKRLIMNCLLVHFQSLKCLSVQFPSIYHIYFQ